MKVTYKFIAPYRSSMVFYLEAEKGLTHNELCNLVTSEELVDAEIVEDWDFVSESWYTDWNASCAKEPKYLHPFDATCIEDPDGNEVSPEKD